jgi:hypothetical protein
MKIKHILSSVVAGASLLTLVGSASAAITGDINIYGASAQFNFWKAQASRAQEPRTGKMRSPRGHAAAPPATSARPPRPPMTARSRSRATPRTRTAQPPAPIPISA